ncbi:response regulator [Rhodobacter veldkampii DSM 11550]|uniref:Response regulator n=1 Tax=Phaeovulum veldkampii DSM 11550 TaxID=1185920 RepID=A0A2T4JGB7_9RHOB|nr:response regulator [Phaeovulum veldkampii]MBK5947768.1 response regulator [Phaeovulum veldkampii DSM 11550]NCU20065.1 response regulator [Candidatus Falkowbacteria bacterium]PTE16959.1 response regulator [Phaeovulum veldkampii DSM 11550]TDQ55988.1 response regulator receiver domain-containing protein [Phaeovulum veldkampii DSM 11550]
MPDDFSQFASPAASISRPLQGLTVLVVEDSRFASEAMRLLCLRSGARIRRADCLRTARRHLQVYRPGAVIVDLGLPDGSGADLIADLAAARPRLPVILAISGDPAGAAPARAAGADGFLTKPIDSLALFQQAILGCLPANARPYGLHMLPDARVEPDRLALRDDLSHVAGVLAKAPDEAAIDYITRFLAGLARSSGDPALADAAADLARGRQSGAAAAPGLARLHSLVAERLNTGATF